MMHSIWLRCRYKRCMSQHTHEFQGLNWSDPQLLKCGLMETMDATRTFYLLSEEYTESTSTKIHDIQGYNTTGLNSLLDIFQKDRSLKKTFEVITVAISPKGGRDPCTRRFLYCLMMVVEQFQSEKGCLFFPCSNERISVCCADASMSWY